MNILSFNNRYGFRELPQAALWLLLLVLLAVPAGLRAQSADDENVLLVPDFEASISRTVNVPVYLDNTQEVVAVQFDVELPFSVPADGTPSMSNRAPSHSVSINAQGGKRFSVVLMSMENKPLRGNSGLLLRLPMTAYDDGQTATPYTIRLTNIVLTDRRGHNIATSSTAEGHFSVSRADLPDLIVGQVAPQTTSVQPSETFRATYVVENAGQGAALVGWTEKVYLESATTGERVFVGSQSYSGELSAGARLSRTFETILPALVHSDGQQLVVVEVVPQAGSGELVVDQANNSAVSTAAVTLGKRLTFTASKLTVAEGLNYGRYYSWRDNITLTVSRSGDWSTAESFPLSCSVDGLFYVGSEDNKLSSSTPYMITIPARSASTTVTLYATDDAIVRARQADLTLGEAHGYNSGTLQITRTDNDTNPLSLGTSLSQMTEGTDGQLTLTATRGGELTDELLLTVACSQPQRFAESPVTITIPIGQQSASTVVTLTDDAIAQLDCSATFSVRATDYQSASAGVRLLDDDRPSLSLTLLPAIVSEASGQQATQAVVRRDRGEGQPMTVYLTSSSPSQAFFEQSSVTFAASEMEKTVAVGVTDNSTVDGQRSHTLTAALYLSADGQRAISGDRAYRQTVVTVTDDETPYLRLSSTSSYVGEGSSLTATVERVVPSYGSAQTVTLTADPSDDVTMPATVTIPAGSTSTTFSVQVKRNSQTGDERPLTIKAEADGLTLAQRALTITDRTLPDGVPSALSVQTTALYSGMPVSLTLDVSNTGTDVLPADMQVEFFLANTSRLYSYTVQTPLLTARTSEAIAAGSRPTFHFEGTLPALVGTYWLFARINGDSKTAEFSTSNNVTTVPVEVSIAAPFRVESLTTDAANYLPGSTAVATGRVVSLLADGLQNQYVNVTMEGSGQSRKTVTCPVDAVTGEYRATLYVSSSASGLLTISARAQGQTAATLSQAVNVWNMSLSADQSRWTLNENYPQTGKLLLRNTSAGTLTGLTIERGTLPYGCQLSELQLPATTLAAGASMEIPYTVTGTQPMTSGQYATFTLAVRSSEGATAQLPVSYYCRATDSRLVFETPQLNTTLLLGSSRLVQLKVTNRGLRATGAIQLQATDGLDWFTCETSDEMDSMEPGESRYINLRLTHQQGQHSGTVLTAGVTLTPATGPAASATLQTTIVGTEYSKLTVDATDIYSRARENYVKVSAAQVTVSSVRTGETLMTGLTDGNGHWETATITEGTYYVTVRAPRHKAVRQTLVIGPGDEQAMHFFLPYQAVLTDFVTDRDEQGRCVMTASIDIDRQAPQAIVVPTLPESGFECGEQTFDVTLTNLGTYDATNVVLAMPTNVADYTFSVDAIPVIKAGGEAVVSVTCKGPEQPSSHSRSIGQLSLSYDWQLGGVTFSEIDSYQSLMGCYQPKQTGGSGDTGDTGGSGVEEPMPRYIPTTPATPDTPTPDAPETENTAEPETAIEVASALPTKGSSMKLTFDDVSRITTGTPFYATLTVVNGQDAALRNIQFIHSVSDDSDDYETDLTTRFDCQQTVESGFTGTAGRYILSGHSEGTIRLLFTPSDEAAADGSHTYYLGGKLSYTDDATGGAHQRALSELAITVTPLGRITVTCLMQGDFAGDYTATDDVREQGVPGQFVVLVQNNGATTVSGLHVYGRLPVVADNATGRPVLAQPLYAGIAGTATSFTLANLTLPKLMGEETLVARSIMQFATDSHLLSGVNLEGASANTDVELNIRPERRLFRAVNDSETHTASADMLGQQAVVAEMAAATAFLLDDDDDDERLPDHVMTADGQEAELTVLNSGQYRFERVEGQAGQCRLTITADKAGWVYGSLTDNILAKMALKSVTKDGRNISAANFWQTDHTVLADYSAIAENRLHFADKVEAGDNVYLLTFTQLGDVIRVVDAKFYAADGSEVSDGQTISQQMTRVVISFTEDADRFMPNGCNIDVDGVPQPSYVPTFSPEGGRSTWVLDYSTLAPIKGPHHFRFQPKKVKGVSNPNNACTDVIEFNWTEDITPRSRVDIEVAGDGGTIDKASGDYAHGPLTLTATPQAGYQFVKWMERDLDLDSDGPVLHFEVKEPTTLRALFAPIVRVLDGMSPDVANGNLYHPEYNGEPTDEQYVCYAVYDFTRSDAVNTQGLAGNSLTAGAHAAYNGLTLAPTAADPLMLYEGYGIMAAGGAVGATYDSELSDLILQLTASSVSSTAPFATAGDELRFYSQLTSQGYGLTLAAADEALCYSSLNVYAPLATAAYRVSIGASGMVTFCAPCALAFDAASGYTAYTARVEGRSVVLTPVSHVPARTGVILQAAPGTYVVRAAETSDTPHGDLTATLVRTVPDGNSNYVLSTDDDGEHNGFYRLPAGGAVQAARAYLTVVGTNAAVLGLLVEEATGIRRIAPSSPSGSAHCYDLSGRRVAMPSDGRIAHSQDGRMAKGVYIVNGKKKLIK